MKRSTLFFIVFIVSIVGAFLTFYYLTDRFRLVFLSVLILGIILSAFFLMASKKQNESKISWILVILYLPLVGLILYLMFGVNSFNRKRFDGKKEVDKKMNEHEEKQSNFPILFKAKVKHERDFIHLIDQMTHTPLYFNTQTRILTNGDEKYDKLFEVLKEAQRFIHMEYFIIHEGEIASKLSEILIEKARAGIEIRILYDDFGCIDLSQAFLKPLREVGVKIAVFNPVTVKMLHDPFNYRNHRKIVIVDGDKGFTGGINIGDEYNHLDDYYGFWRDTHIYLEGDAVRSMSLVFSSDWEFTTGESLRDDYYLQANAAKEHSGAVQVISDGPDHEMTVIKNLFFKAISEATDRIIIQTPYLIPDYDIIKAIQIAALSGVDVKILVPGKPDKFKNFVYKATQSYFEDFLDYGCEIYTYNNRFMHSKVIVVDDKIATIGTANLDFISLNTNFEIVTVLYYNHCIKKLAADFYEDLTFSTKIDPVEWKNRPYVHRFGETLARLLSPIM